MPDVPFTENNTLRQKITALALASIIRQRVDVISKKDKLLNTLFGSWIILTLILIGVLDSTLQAGSGVIMAVALASFAVAMAISIRISKSYEAKLEPIDQLWYKARDTLPDTLDEYTYRQVEKLVLTEDLTGNNLGLIIKTADLARQIALESPHLGLIMGIISLERYRTAALLTLKPEFAINPKGAS